MHVVIPSTIKEKSFWKDSLRIYLARIDDADEVYLNGQLVGKSGSFPRDASGYQTAWDEEREYHLATNNPVIKWDKENVIAIRVYDGGGLGGMSGGTPFIDMMDLIDGVKMEIRLSKTNEVDKISTPLYISSNIHQPVSGLLKLKITDTETGKIIKTENKQLVVTPDKNIVAEISVPKGRRIDIDAQFMEINTGKTISIRKVTPYILTPPVANTPRINGAVVFGVRPGSKFLFKIAATGEKPLQYAVENLPADLKVNTNTGVLTGTLKKPVTIK